MPGPVRSGVHLFGVLASLLFCVALGRPAAVQPQSDRLGQAPLFPGGLVPADGAVTVSAVVPTGGLTVNVSSRAAVKSFYSSVYTASENVAVGWTGKVSTCSPGTTSAAYLAATLRRVNFYRAMAGVPASIVFNTTWNAWSQRAALMMAANEGLSHDPPRTWKCYERNGAAAAGSSNLAIGSVGPAAVDGLMKDPGAGNEAAGHRRWILYPPTRKMGAGSVDYVTPIFNYHGACVLYVFDTAGWAKGRPATRSSYIAWPPAGYTPYQLVWARWSFAYPDADFSAAAVSMTRRVGTGAATTLSVAKEALAPGYGDNTLVWRPMGLRADREDPWPKPSADTAVTVKISNVKVNGVARTFSYTVRIFDPAK